MVALTDQNSQIRRSAAILLTVLKVEEDAEIISRLQDDLKNNNPEIRQTIVEFILQMFINRKTKDDKDGVYLLNVLIHQLLSEGDVEIKRKILSELSLLMEELLRIKSIQLQDQIGLLITGIKDKLDT